MTDLDPRSRPTVPPESCPADRQLTALCREIVRDRKNREAQRKLALMLLMAECGKAD